MKTIFYTTLACLLLFSCQNDKSATAEIKTIERVSGSQQMRDSIHKIIAKTNFRNHFYENGEKVKLIAQEVNTAKENNNVQPKLYVEYGKTLLNAGQTQEAINVFNDLLEKLPANRKISSSKQKCFTRH